MAIHFSEISEGSQELVRELAAGILTASSKHWPPEEKPGENFAPQVNPKDFAQGQIALLEKIASMVQKVAKEICALDESALLVYVTGSTARLENLEGTSDIDLLAVLLVNDGRHDHKAFARFEAGIEKEWSGMTGAQAPISVSGCFHEKRRLCFFKKEPQYVKRFFRRRELFESVGKEYEAPWASFERASLLFESVLVYGDASLAAQLEADLDKNIYTITKDILSERFPVVGYCLVNHIKHSGVLAKAAALYKDDGDPEVLASGAAKVVLSRLWSAKIHMLALHVLYWDVIMKPVEKGKAWKAGELRQRLAQPPIFKAALTIPSAVQSASERVSSLSRLSEFTDPAQLKSLIEDIRTFHKRLCLDGNDHHVPLWYRFLQISSVCRQLRSGEAGMSHAVGSKLVTWIHEMNDLLRDACRISHKIGTGMRRRSLAFKMFHDVIAEHLYGSMTIAARQDGSNR
jgi:predicted nucleotidyltransferase